MRQPQPLAGQADADLGGGAYKQRIAREGGGKSSGFRTLLICVHADVIVFEYGFGKNARDNIDEAELRALKKSARAYADLSIEQLADAASLVEIEEDV